MLCKVVKLQRCSDGWQHCSRSCQKIKVFKLKVRSVLVGRPPFRTIETAHFESELSQYFPTRAKRNHRHRESNFHY